MSYTVVIADDHPLTLKGLAAFLIPKKFTIVGSAQDGNTAFNLIIKHKPDIAILDIRMPQKTGLEIAEACFKNGIDTKIILITFDKGADLFKKAKQFNIYGYILKEFAVEEIDICLEYAIQNKPYFNEKLTSYLNCNSIDKPKKLELLTKSELKIAKLISKNNTSQEIANELSISIKTVHKHRSNMIKKLTLEDKPVSLSVWANSNKDFL